ncbi:MAG: hypothetical protein KIT56_08925, partial [Gammaproteobacteria bacterium]|nr:hypothetical protein [Gammaproteobacteria bacterium]
MLRTDNPSKQQMAATELVTHNVVSHANHEDTISQLQKNLYHKKSELIRTQSIDRAEELKLIHTDFKTQTEKTKKVLNIVLLQIQESVLDIHLKITSPLNTTKLKKLLSKSLLDKNKEIDAHLKKIQKIDDHLSDLNRLLFLLYSNASTYIRNIDLNHLMKVMEWTKQHTEAWAARIRSDDIVSKSYFYWILSFMVPYFNPYRSYNKLMLVNEIKTKEMILSTQLELLSSSLLAKRTAINKININKKTVSAAKKILKKNIKLDLQLESNIALCKRSAHISETVKAIRNKVTHFYCQLTTDLISISSNYSGVKRSIRELEEEQSRIDYDFSSIHNKINQEITVLKNTKSNKYNTTLVEKKIKEIEEKKCQFTIFEKKSKEEYQLILNCYKILSEANDLIKEAKDYVYRTEIHRSTLDNKKNTTKQRNELSEKKASTPSYQNKKIYFDASFDCLIERIQSIINNDEESHELSTFKITPFIKESLILIEKNLHDEKNKISFTLSNFHNIIKKLNDDRIKQKKMEEEYTETIKKFKAFLPGASSENDLINHFIPICKVLNIDTETLGLYDDIFLQLNKISRGSSTFKNEHVTSHLIKPFENFIVLLSAKGNNSENHNKMISILNSLNSLGFFLKKETHKHLIELVDFKNPNNIFNICSDVFICACSG